MPNISNSFTLTGDTRFNPPNIVGGQNSSRIVGKTTVYSKQ